jgi:hypothetical protein
MTYYNNVPPVQCISYFQKKYRALVFIYIISGNVVQSTSVAGATLASGSDILLLWVSEGSILPLFSKLYIVKFIYFNLSK